MAARDDADPATGGDERARPHRGRAAVSDSERSVHVAGVDRGSSEPGFIVHARIANPTTHYLPQMAFLHSTSRRSSSLANSAAVLRRDFFACVAAADATRRAERRRRRWRRRRRRRRGGGGFRPPNARPWPRATTPTPRPAVTSARRAPCRTWASDSGGGQARTPTPGGTTATQAQGRKLKLFTQAQALQNARWQRSGTTVRHDSWRRKRRSSPSKQTPGSARRHDSDGRKLCPPAPTHEHSHEGIKAGDLLS